MTDTTGQIPTPVTTDPAGRFRLDRLYTGAYTFDVTSPGFAKGTVEKALAERARLAAGPTLPKGTVHILSDVHGDDVKLRHVINNASGSVRRLVEQLFAARLPPAALQELLTLIFYPRETLERLAPALTDDARQQAFARETLGRLFELIR